MLLIKVNMKKDIAGWSLGCQVWDCDPRAAHGPDRLEEKLPQYVWDHKNVVFWQQQINKFRDILAMAGTVPALRDGRWYTRFLEVHQTPRFPRFENITTMARLPALSMDVPGWPSKILSYPGIWLQVLKMLQIQHYFWNVTLLITSCDFMADL